MEAAAAPKRAYRMTARAEAAAATRRAIAEAFLALFVELHYDELTLDQVAARAGTTVQTILRHFGSKDELFLGATREIAAAETARRAIGAVGDVPAAVRAVVAHYERIGDWVLRVLEQEDRFPPLRRMTDPGRQIHYDWVERSFAPFLAARDGAARRRLRGQLVALTDVYMWKLFRRDLGFGPRQTETAMAEMIEGVL